MTRFSRISLCLLAAAALAAPLHADPRVQSRVDLAMAGAEAVPALIEVTRAAPLDPLAALPTRAERARPTPEEISARAENIRDRARLLILLLAAAADGGSAFTR